MCIDGPTARFFFVGGGEWVFVHRLRLLTIEIKVKINYKVSVFAYLSHNKRTHGILEDEDYISHIWDAFFPALSTEYALYYNC